MGFSGQSISNIAEVEPESQQEREDKSRRPALTKEPRFSIRDDVGDVECEEPELYTATFGKKPETKYPPMRSVILIIAALDLIFFLVALDRTIIATAVPQITDAFSTLRDVGWYGSAYMLTECTFQLLMGRIYTFYSPKLVFLTAIGCFEIGSIICGSATNTYTFILGRAIAGLGSSGVFSGAFVLITHTIPPEKRPMLQGMVGAVFGIASVTGPLLGGIFASSVSWRLCFYINLPIGGIAMLVLIWVLDVPKPARPTPTFVLEDKLVHRQHSIPLAAVRESYTHRFLRLDPVGTLLFLPGITCLLLALQRGGSVDLWSSPQVLTPLVLSVVLLAAFTTFQKTIPPRIIKQRTIAAAMAAQFCIGGSMLSMTYYLPLWFQAVEKASPMHSGVMNLPLILFLILASLVGGILVSRLGYYTPPLIGGCMLMTLGAALMSTFEPNTSTGRWISYQVLYGTGLGLSLPQTSLAAQTVLQKADIATGIALMQFSQQLGGAVFLSVSQSVFANGLISHLERVAGISGVDAKADLLSVGATELGRWVGGGVEVAGSGDGERVLLGKLDEAYDEGLTGVFFLVAVVSAVGGLVGLGAGWRSIRGGKKEGGHG